MIPIADRISQVQEYYFSKKLKEIDRLKKEGKNIISLGVGSPDLDPPKEALLALQEAILENNNQYQSYVGISSFREAIAGFYQNNYNVTLNPESEVLPLMGSKEGIMHICMAFVNKGEAILLPNPGYPTYSSVANLVEAKKLYYTLSEENDWLPDMAELNELAKQKPKLMWLNYPHMPTGAKINKEKLTTLVQWAKEKQVLLVNDNPYAFILNESPLSIFNIEGAKETCLELNSLSKTFNLSGWRVGMLLGHSKLLKEVLKVKSNMDSGMYYALQKGASAALKVEDDWYEKMNSVYEKRRRLIWEICEKLNLSYAKDRAGMFVWAKVSKGIDVDSFVDGLLHKQGIFITPGHVFGSQGKNYVRFSLCATEEKIREAKQRLQ